jgi:hypothetical protein
LEQKEDSLWYRSLRLIRNQKPGGKYWRELVESVANELSEQADSLRRGIGVKEAPDASDRAIPIVHPDLQEDAAVENNGTAIFLGDTTVWLHWGMSCSSLAVLHHLQKFHDCVIPFSFHRLIASPLIYPKSLEDFDSDEFWITFTRSRGDIVSEINRAKFVYVNGTSEVASKPEYILIMLYVIYASKKRLNKVVSVLNHTLYSTRKDDASVKPLVNGLLKKVLQAVDDVYARDQRTVARLNDLNVTASPSFDFLPLYIRDCYSSRASGDEKKVVISGLDDFGPEFFDKLSQQLRNLLRDGLLVDILIGSRRFIPENDLKSLSGLQDSIRAGVRVIDATSEAEWLTTIGSASVLISSGFYHNEAATCLGVPTILIKRSAPLLHPLIEESKMVTVIDLSSGNGVEAIRDSVWRELHSETRFNPSRTSFLRMCEAAEASFSKISGHLPEASDAAHTRAE